MHRPAQQRAPAARPRRSRAATSTAIGARDLDGAVAMWAPGGSEHVRGQVDVPAPEGVRVFIGEMIEAMPDMRCELLDTTTEGERCAVHWRMHRHVRRPGRAERRRAHRHPLELEGFDLLTVRDGLIHTNDAFTDTMTFARQIGMMPPQDSPAEQRMTGAFNAKTRLTAGCAAARRSWSPRACGSCRDSPDDATCT